jgi:hypothetical protein
MVEASVEEEAVQRRLTREINAALEREEIALRNNQNSTGSSSLQQTRSNAAGLAAGGGNKRQKQAPTRTSISTS